MKKLITTVKVEWLKIKSLGLVYLALVLGILIPLFEFVNVYFNQEIVTGEELKYSVIENSISNNIGSFAFYLLLLYIIIASNRITQTDHKNNGWQLMETQPINKLTIYFSKYIVLLLLSFLCILFYCTSSILFTSIDFYIHQEPAKLLTFDMAWILKNFLRLFIASLGITAFQLCLSILLRGFIWPFLIGFLGLVINTYSWAAEKSIPYFPYNSLYFFRKSAEIKKLNSFITFSEYLSISWMFLFLIIGYQWYSKKGFKRAFFRSQKTIVFSFIFVIASAISLYTLHQPKSYKSSGSGVMIKGTIETDHKIDYVKIFSKDFHELIISIPVKNKQFFWKTDQKLPFDQYIVEFDNKKIKIMMGNGDRFDFNIKYNYIDSKDFIRTNRAADQQYIKAGKDEIQKFKYVAESPDYQNNPHKFYQLAENEWEKGLRKIENYIDAENNGLSNPYKEYRKQLLAIGFLNEINNYRKMTSLNNSLFTPPKKLINELNASIRKPSMLLGKDSQYLEFKLDQLLSDKERLSANSDSILFVKLNTMPGGIEKDRLVTAQLIKSLNLENDSTKRKQFFASESRQVTNPDYKKLLLLKFNEINLSKKGGSFPDLLLEKDTGGTERLSQYKGKYIIIDFWASWCAPCRSIRPVFDTRSAQYRYYNNIKFISISLDQDKGKWLKFLKTQPSRIPQYWLNDAQAFMDKYKVDAIPRFIIIDKEGKIFDFDAPFPVEDNFVEILDKIKKL
ncbi:MULTISPECIES: thioredoxin-like domain-containing protein [Chryseobacterium]|jgi:thiol-disulfide isomerase/thioredoxin|uniref:Thiol-disulfide isomerase/thioredoxin n=1 Tax=Chryseobacterium geocarposphaerae TaxID=1416776 RepID=A0ABU1LBF2_9FLAO|nr:MULTISPECIES: thioredoxin-like domain-containing protein [Chryseobacterium]MDR6404056.1 thiol-disulfide isomerase/thioredoxin [Chryseobacterium geocarposphaerae]MDR6698425.1 thiol-disulfide isomerase/thioredoxin [Chryseobacterium ginsenosidimutans]